LKISIWQSRSIKTVLIGLTIFIITFVIIVIFTALHNQPENYQIIWKDDYLLITGCSLSAAAAAMIIMRHALSKAKDEISRIGHMFRRSQLNVLLIDPETSNFISINPAANRFYNYGDDFQNMGLRDIDTRPASEVISDIRNCMRKNGKMWQTHHKLSNGQLVEVECLGTPIMVNGKQVISIIVIDVNVKSRAHEEARRISLVDPVTGLYNRAYAEAEIERLSRGRNLPLSIIFGDVDNLKKTNDRFGHSAGDTLLREIANCLTDACRAEDIICRYGGDEYIMILPYTTTEQAILISQRIEENCKVRSNGDIHLSISLGYATKTSHEEDTEDIIDTADSMMYENKQNKKNLAK
jgi:diguanylate cyclase (GGDEF)-like protein